jgi:D-alanine-D-alanine ligase
VRRRIATTVRAPVDGTGAVVRVGRNGAARPGSRTRSRLRIGLAFNRKPDDPGTAPGGTPTDPRRPAPADLYAEWDDEVTIAALEAALRESGEVTRLEATEDFPLRLREARPDIVFNVAEGLWGPNREAHVPALCEFWGIPYTGSDPLTLALCLDKGRAKEILAYQGVPTAEFAVVSGGERLSAMPSLPPLPVVVKPIHEGSSKGITQASLCRTRAEVGRAVGLVWRRYRQPALVERWLPGREFTCAVLGNGPATCVLPVVEVDFDALPRGAERLYSYEAKWVWDTPDRPLSIFRCPAPVSPGLGRRIEQTVLAAYRGLRCRDWARIDVRCDARGVPHILEVNPLPGILPDPAMNSCFPKAARAAGLDYGAMIRAVLEAGAGRYGVTV